jgi:hypothetical protein
MTYDRKTFLKMSGIMASGMAVGTLPFLKSCAPENRTDQPFGLQLYTLRDVIVDDPEGTLRQVADYGYTQIESYEGPMGMWWDMGNTGFKNLMDELGMTVISTHANVFEDFERKANEAAEIGLKYIVSHHGSARRTALTIIVKLLISLTRRVKLQIMHRPSVSRITITPIRLRSRKSQMPQDVLMENTDPDLVEYQMDIYWVVVAGHDPALNGPEDIPAGLLPRHVKDLANPEDPGINGDWAEEPSIFGQLLPELAAEHGMEALHRGAGSITPVHHRWKPFAITPNICAAWIFNNQVL